MRTMFELGSTSSSSSAAQVDFLDLCKVDVKSIENVVAGGALLNRRQCEDLSSKLSQTIPNIQELLVYCGPPNVLFRPVLENLYRHLEKAKALVSECAKEDWCAAAVFQCQNENAFREILLDVGFCYNAIYEVASSKSKVGWNPPEDLRKSPILLEAASDSDVDEDKQDLQKRLDELANRHTKVKRLDYIIPGRVAQKQSVARRQSLAHHLYVKMYWKSKEPKARTLEAYTAIMWRKESEPTETWGNSSFLGRGSGAAGVCSTTWLGIPCAKKEFHGDGSESTFKKEAGILAHLKHPCIVDFICCGNGSDQGDRFICMELMEISLFDLIEEQRRKGEYFEIDVALDMIVQIAHGVCYLHGEGVAHRDLKPHNVVAKRLSSGQEVDHYCVKLVDFGVSKGEVQVSQSNTMTYRGIGTTSYRAPEVHPKANPNGTGRVKWLKADTFSFAMTCAHLLCLEIPFKDIMASELYDEVIKNKKRPMIPNMYPRELIQLLKDCWNIKPHSRPSFIQICVCLEEIRYKNYMKSYSTPLDGVLENGEYDSYEGVDFIKLKLKSSIKPPLIDGDEDESNIKDYVSIISCTCGCALQLLPQVPSYYNGCYCNICCQDIDGELYHCEACHFDAHTHCAEIQDHVKEFFHHHTLHLLAQDYYKDQPDVICCLCKEPVQHSKWVYRCEQCNIDVHLLCSKFPEKIDHVNLHEHVIIMRQCPYPKSFTCTCCNGKVKEYTWHYTCSSKICAVYFHPLCAIISDDPLCIFETSHRFILVRRQKSFYCAKCATLQVSWSYHCDTCDVDIHFNCLDNIEETKEEKWIKAYDTFMLENESKNHCMTMIMLSELVDKVPMGYVLEGSSTSTSCLPQVITRVQPSIQRPTLEEQLRLEALDNDANLRRQIVAETTERMKAKKIAAKEARQKVSTDLPEMLEKLENKIVDLHSSWSNMSEAEVLSLATTYKELTRRQELVKDQMAMLVQSRMNQAPQIAVFWKWRVEEGDIVRKILTSLRADMEEVCYALLCEEPGHEHVIPGAGKIFNVKLREERAEKLQPLIAGGLDVVRRALSTLEPHELKSRLRSVIVPCLGVGDSAWDLGAMEDYGNRSVDECEDAEKVEVLKRAEDSAVEWFREFLENDGNSMLSDGQNILEIYGLQRVRFTVTSREDDVWKHGRGNVAWVCKDHVDSGLESGTLELFPSLKY